MAFLGRVNEEEMWGTFNMGIGFVLIVDAKDKEKVIEILEKNGLTSPIKQGYMFKGWNIENTTKINEDTIIKALWSRIE